MPRLQSCHPGTRQGAKGPALACPCPFPACLRCEMVSPRACNRLARTHAAAVACMGSQRAGGFGPRLGAPHAALDLPWDASRPQQPPGRPDGMLPAWRAPRSARLLCCSCRHPRARRWRRRRPPSRRRRPLPSLSTRSMRSARRPSVRRVSFCCPGVLAGGRMVPCRRSVQLSAAGWCRATPGRHREGWARCSAAFLGNPRVTSVGCVAALVFAAIGGDLPPKRDMHRFVKWPKYVRIQRQRRVLNQRLKVGCRPPLPLPGCMLQPVCQHMASGTASCGSHGDQPAYLLRRVRQ